MVSKTIKINLKADAEARPVAVLVQKQVFLRAVFLFRQTKRKLTQRALWV